MNEFAHRALKVIRDYSIRWFVGILILAFGYLFIRLFDRSLEKIFKKTELDPTVELFIQRSLKAFLWIVLIILVLANLGVNVTGLLAGLGVVGLIVGLAVKEVLSNLAAGLFVLIVKPFKVGEEIELGGVKGIVREINIYACVIVTEDGKFVTIPNSKVWSGPIKNLSRLKEK